MLLLLFTLVSSVLVVHADTRDVTLDISQDAINSASTVYFQAGKMHYSGPLPDNTTTGKLKKLVPKAYKLCPDCPIDFAVQATVAPTTLFSSTTGATLQVYNAMLNLTAAAAYPVGSPVHELMVLGFNASCGLNFSNSPAASGDYIKPSITIVKIKLVVESSNVGILANAAIALLGPLVDTFLQDVAIPAFNKEFPGFPLPTVAGFAISDFVITTNNGYLGVGLDILPSTTLEEQTEIQPPLVSRKLIVARPAVTKAVTSQVTSNPPGFSGPGVIATVGGAGLNKLLKALIPKIVAEVNGITIPAMSGKASGIEYSIGAIAVSGFTIGTSSLTFVAGKGLNLRLGGLGLTIPSTSFDIKKKILFTHISCGGHFNGGLGNTGVNVAINVTAVEPAGQPKILSTDAWTWGSLSVNVKLSNVFCKIIKDIASWFMYVVCCCSCFYLCVLFLLSVAHF